MSALVPPGFNPTIHHKCNVCCRHVNEPMPATYTTTIGGPRVPWYCEREACQEAKSRGLVYGWGIRPEGEPGLMMLEELEHAEEHITQSEDGDEWIVVRLAKTQAEWDALPEFGGW